MILKYWDNKTGTWILKDGFCEIHHKKMVDEKNKRTIRIITGYYDDDHVNPDSPDYVIKEDVNKIDDFTLAYILNNEGKTIERIN